MEADIAVELHTTAQEADIKYTNVTGDEDSSSIKYIRDHVNSEINKCLDITQIKRSLANRMEKLPGQNTKMTRLKKLELP